MGTGGAAPSSGTFCASTTRQQLFISNLASWPGSQQKPAAQPEPAGQGGRNEVLHYMFL